jgi:hypothetical protein
MDYRLVGDRKLAETWKGRASDNLAAIRLLASIEAEGRLKLLHAAYPAHTAIKLILDNHSAHISKETKAWLAEQPAELDPGFRTIG